MARLIGWLLSLDRVEAVDRLHLALGAEWSTHGSGPFWMVLGIGTIVVLVTHYYIKLETRGTRTARIALAACRTVLLALLLLTLAEPMLYISVTRSTPPTLFVVFDGTGSMEIRDWYTTAQRSALTRNTGLAASQGEKRPGPTRQQYVQAWLKNDPERLFRRLEREGKCRLRCFLFDGQSTSRVRELSAGRRPTRENSGRDIADELTTNGQVTALGQALRDLARQPEIESLSGVILVSDFVQNAGELPLGNADSSGASPVGELGVPIYAIGVGAGRNRDLAIQLETEPKIRRGEKTMIRLRLQQTDLDGQATTVHVQARSLSGGEAAPAPHPIGRQQVVLTEPSATIELPYVPSESGDVELTATADAVAGEAVTQNNRVARRVQVIDDYIRLLYVAQEPTWEWRFVKEVFHRDPAVGINGFRSYLASSDPRVREANPLFLPSLTPDRSAFFTNDVVFLDDVPHAALTGRFGEMVEQFVRDLGGGLVVIAGPRFGPEQLLNTPVAAMLPVIIDPEGRLRDRRAFRLRLTPRAREYAFMQLGDTPEETGRAWANLGDLPWYRPVANKHERAVVLAEHPTDTCLDGKTPQPLIAIRRYGAGEVVYLGFNEMWRLRRKYGERYYRRFWMPLIDRLGLSHALGARKRFVPRLDRRRYRVDDEVIISVHAYDQNYEPLEPAEIDGGSLEAELIGLDGDARAEPTRHIRISALRAGIFETRVAVYVPGTYRLRVKDPIDATNVQRQFEVSGTTAEMRSSVRDEAMQELIAASTHGRSYTLEDVDRLPDEIKLEPRRQHEVHNYALWSTPGWFLLIVGLMLGEWAVRKRLNLA